MLISYRNTEQKLKLYRIKLGLSYVWVRLHFSCNVTSVSVSCPPFSICFYRGKLVTHSQQVLYNVRQISKMRLWSFNFCPFQQLLSSWSLCHITGRHYGVEPLVCWCICVCPCIPQSIYIFHIFFYICQHFWAYHTNFSKYFPLCLFYPFTYLIQFISFMHNFIL